MIIDLCSGLGRWPDDDTISIDFDLKTQPTILADIRFLPLRKALRPNLAHASPPCKYFSLARFRHYGYDEKGVAEGLRLVAACFDAFDWLEPKMWTLENPIGLLRCLLPPTATTVYGAADYKHKRTDFFSNNRALRRSIIPQDIRQMIMDNIPRTNARLPEVEKDASD
jgi:hypothetical protein